MHRFFVPREWLESDRVLIGGEQAHQITHVLRLNSGDHIVVLDNSGWEYEVQIEKVSGEAVQAKTIGKVFCPNEPEIKLTLYQALLKADKFELILQKGVELGVSAFVPFTCARCVVSIPGESKLDRWRKIIREAAEQSRRALLPDLHPVVSFEEACQQAGGLSLLPWEGAKSPALSAVLRSLPFQKPKALNVYIGPEGGFPASEVAYAESKGIIMVSLGRRILRAETAGIAVISAIMYEMGEFG